MAGIALSMVATPFLAEAGNRVARRLRVRAPAMLTSLQDEALGLSGHVIMRLRPVRPDRRRGPERRAEVPYLALDLDPGRVGIIARADCACSMATRAGSTCSPRPAPGARARWSSPWTSPRGSTAPSRPCIEHFPPLRIFVRARHVGHRSQLVRHGATAVVPEAAEASLQLGSLVLGTLGFGADAVVRLATDDLRRADYAGLQEIEGSLAAPDNRRLAN